MYLALITESSQLPKHYYVNIIASLLKNIS
jgi:hypothetical protein